MNTIGPSNKPVGSLSPGEELRLKRQLETQQVSLGKLVQALRDGTVQPGADLERLQKMILAGGDERTHADTELVLRSTIALMHRAAMAPIRQMR